MKYLTQVLAFLQGKKSYLVSGATVLFGLLGLVLGFMPQDQAIAVILGGLGLGSLRASIK